MTLGCVSQKNTGQGSFLLLLVTEGLTFQNSYDTILIFVRE